MPPRPLLARILLRCALVALAAIPSHRAAAQGSHTVAPAPSTAAAAAAAAADSVPEVAREFRGAWVATVANIDWPSRRGLGAFEQQAEMLAFLDRAVALRLNAIVLQVRPAGDAIYPSALEPWSEYLTGVQGRAPEPYYDPLEFAIEAAHARGLELHAWFNPYRARHGSARGPGARTHMASGRDSSLVQRYGTMLWMDPGEPRVIARTLDVIADVVRRYDVDGVHLDDYFYPYPITGPDSQPVDFPDSASFARYVRGGGRLARHDWRRHNVDTLVQRLYRRTKAVKPWVKVGVSPFGIWRPGHPAGIQGFDAYDRLYADSRKWLREGWVDYWAPQLYWPIAQAAQSYPVLLDWWMQENVKGRHVWVGHNTSRAAGTTWPADELPEQIRRSRVAGATGAIHFSMRALMPEGRVRRDTVLTGVATPPPQQARAAALAERLREGVYAAPALVPAMPWSSTRRPAAPTARVTVDAASGDHVLRLAPAGAGRIAWWTVRVREGDAWRTHVLPGAQRRLVVANAGAAAPARVVVTAIDRFGTESTAVEARRLPASGPGRPTARPPGA